jgi:hypothetical protein
MQSYLVVYGCETWSLRLKEEDRLKIFENMMLRRIFGPNRYEIIGGFRELHDGELHKLYASTNIIIIIESKRIRWAGHVARMGEREEECVQNFGGRTRKKETTRKMYA